MKSFITVCLLASILMLFGCQGGEAPTSDTAKSVVANIVYSRDARTGLCFGSIKSLTHSGFEVVSITSVPCDKVEKFLVK